MSTLSVCCLLSLRSWCADSQTLASGPRLDKTSSERSMGVWAGWDGRVVMFLEMALVCARRVGRTVSREGQGAGEEQVGEG